MSSTTPPPPPTDPTRQESGWSRLLEAAKPRANRKTAVATALALALGFAVATQVQATGRQGLESLRTTDLVRILDDQTSRNERLDLETRRLQATRDELVNGSSKDEAAVKAATERLNQLRILAGTVKATGPGITMTITGQPGQVTYPTLLDLVQELRDAGAEAIQIGTARVVAQSYIAEHDGALYVDNTKLTLPYTIKAVGDGDTLQAAMNFPGGIVETIRQQGAEATVTKAPSVLVDALQQPPTDRYARPVPSASPSAP